jgi:hypothetical protein
MSRRRVVLSELPRCIPYTQIGTPLSEGQFIELPEAEKEALSALHDLRMALLEDEVELDDESYTSLERLYRKVKELGLAHYCPVVRTAAQFELDEEAMRKSTAASVTAVCVACH